ncbi:hypothetical protein WH47_03150 [Habropoda laboriosa]|uniref:Uncharacterized protein n=1 Tax=Habropoda laboriosa TaxID=597456 RepID=A0A0L7QY10_9HYME|nr:hypothetical protein WH47_03150 [Habropoda laboriosa]
MEATRDSKRTPRQFARMNDDQLTLVAGQMISVSRHFVAPKIAVRYTYIQARNNVNASKSKNIPNNKM